MSACFYVFEDDFFKIPTGDAFVIKKYVVTVDCQVLVDRQSSRNICAPIADEDCFLDARCHGWLL